MAERERIKLAPEMIKALEELEEDIAWIEEELRRAKRAGIDVEELERDYEKAKRMREGLLREYR
jgi:hypothetical protein